MNVTMTGTLHGMIEGHALPSRGITTDFPEDIAALLLELGAAVPAADDEEEPPAVPAVQPQSAPETAVAAAADVEKRGPGRPKKD